jgi:hypothetical protein
MKSSRTIFTRALVVSVAVWHLLPSSRFLSADAAKLFASYFSDIVMPCTFFFLLGIAARRHRLLRGTTVRAVTVFALPSIAETLQAAHLPVLGSTFDPYDYLAYAVGVALALLLDRLPFMRRAEGGASSIP